MGRYELRIGDFFATSASAILTDFFDLQFNKNHTSLSDWSAKVKWDESLRDYLLERVYVYDTQAGTDDESIIYVGLLESIDDSTRDDGTGKISGRGVLVEEEWDSTTVSYRKEFLHDAIDTFGTVELGKPHQINIPNKYSQLVNKTPQMSDVDNNNELLYETNRGIAVDYIAYNIEFEESEWGFLDNDADRKLLTNEDGFSHGNAIRLGEGTSNTVSLTINESYFEHDVGTNFEIPLRIETTGLISELRLYHSGTLVRSTTSPSDGWEEPYADWTVENTDTQSLNGTDFTLEVDTSDNDRYIDVDVWSFIDKDYSYTLSSTLNENDVYNEPKMFPDETEAQFVINDTAPDTDASVIYEVSDTKVDGDGVGFTEFATNIYSRQDLVTNEDNNWVKFKDIDNTTNTNLNYEILLQRSSDEPTERTGRYDMQELNTVVLIPFKDKGISYLVDRNITGTNLGILKELHNIGSWRFDVTANTTPEVRSFVVGEAKQAGDITIKSESQKVDYSDYANKITVTNGQLDSATVESQAEINAVGETFHRTFVKPEANSYSELFEKAESILTEKIQNRKEAGSLSAVPTEIDVGYEYQFPQWEDRFSGGTQVENGAAYYNANQTEWVTQEVNGAATETIDIDMALEVVVWVDLSDLGTDEYTHIVSSENAHDLLRVYGDGSIGVENPSDEHSEPVSRSASGVVESQTRQRVSVFSYYDFDADTLNGEVYVDGGTFGSPDHTFTTSKVGEPGYVYLGSAWPQRRLHRSKIDAHWEMDTNTISGGLLEDSYYGSTQNPLTDNGFTEMAGKWRGAVEIDSAAPLDSGDSTVWNLDATSNDAFTVSMWVRPDASSYVLFQKGDVKDSSVEGYQLYADFGDLYFEVTGENGTNQIEMAGEADTLEDGSWHHVAASFNTDGDAFKVYIDGTEVGSLISGDLGSVSNTEPFQLGGAISGGAGVVIMDDVRMYYPDQLTQSEVSELANFSLADNNFSDALDDYRLWNINLDTEDDDTTRTSAQVLLDNPYTAAMPGTDLEIVLDGDSGVSGDGIVTYWRFENLADSATHDITDYATSGNTNNHAILNGVTIETRTALLDEVSYSLSSDSSSMDLKFDIQKRVDVQLNETKTELESTKRSL